MFLWYLAVTELDILVDRRVNISLAVGMKFKIILIFTLFVCQLLVGQTIIYVDKDAAEGGNGTSWATAYKYLNDALNRAGIVSGDYQIWVAEGIYYPDEGSLYSDDDPNSKFSIPNSVSEIIGGFIGTETSADQADPDQYETTLSGFIYENYGFTDTSSSFLFMTQAGNSPLTVKGFNFDNLERVIYISSGSDRSLTTFEKCSFLDIQSDNTLISATSNVLFRNCRFERNQSPGLVYGGSFESCYFDQNNVSSPMLSDVKMLNRCFITNNVSTSELISLSGNIINTLFYRNNNKGTGSTYLIRIYGNWRQILHSSFIDNYSYRNDEHQIGGGSSFTIGNCIFFSSGLNNSSILESTAVVGYKSSLNLPVQSAFFGIFDYYQGSNYGSTDSLGSFIELSSKSNRNPYEGGSTFKSSFFNTYGTQIPSSTGTVLISPEQLNGQSAAEYLNSYRLLNGGNLGVYNSYNPDLTPILLPDLVISDPFVNSSDPLGPDGQPFTEDDGLRLDPDSQWASDVINVETIPLDYEVYDILGNPRIAGGLVDLGAYEYTPQDDADSDGISDANDAFPNDPSEIVDTDGDNLGDNQDSDDDGDGVDDSVEIAIGTDPKQYDSILYDLAQNLRSGAYDADDISDSRLSGQGDVTLDPNSFSLFTAGQVDAAAATGRSEGQGDVTSDPNSFSLYSSSDLSAERILGQEDVVTSPLDFGLYSPSYVVSLLNAAAATGRSEGQGDVTSDPNSFSLYSASDLSAERTLGQEDVVANPLSFGLYSSSYVAQLDAALTTARSEGQGDVTSDPNSFSLYSASDLSAERTLGQEDVVTSPLSFGLYSSSYVVSLLDSSRTAGQSDVISDPSSYGLYSEQGITDLRPGSTILQLGPNNSATLELQIQRSNDLSNWTADTDDLVEVEIPLNEDTEFFRFKMTE